MKRWRRPARRRQVDSSIQQTFPWQLCSRTAFLRVRHGWPWCRQHATARLAAARPASLFCHQRRFARCAVQRPPPGRQGLPGPSRTVARARPQAAPARAGNPGAGPGVISGTHKRSFAEALRPRATVDRMPSNCCASLSRRCTVPACTRAMHCSATPPPWPLRKPCSIPAAYALPSLPHAHACPVRAGRVPTRREAGCPTRVIGDALAVCLYSL